jgi:membrane protein DedA with SNARE-associated domain
MASQLGFLLKLLLFSALGSVFIKSADPLWIPPTVTNALIMVVSPTVIMAILLLWRIPKQQQN